MTRSAMIDEAVTDAMRDRNLLRVWQRYKMACAGIDAQIESGRNFTWGK